MLKVIGFGLVSSVVMLGACGPGSPQDECNNVANAACSKLYQCVDANTLKITFGYADQNACVTTFESTLHCSTAKDQCAAPKTYSTSACASDINGLACNQALGGLPPSCNPANFCQ